MKILVLGDIHGRLCWWDIINHENPDKIIFLGDYVSTHDDISGEQQCMNLEDILNYKEDNPENVILLRGNHDIQHLGYYWAECSGFNHVVYKWMSEPHIKERFLRDTQWVYLHNNYILSHAGVSKTWFNRLNLGELNSNNLLKINELEPSELFAFTPDRYSDYCGDSITQPCTWIRPTSLIMDAVDGWNQIVGHTRMRKPGNILGEGDLEFYRDSWGFTIKELWCVDALPFHYMIIEDDNVEMRNFNYIKDI